MAAVTYKKAGVNIDEADLFIKKIKPLVRSTVRPEVMGTIDHPAQAQNKSL